VGFPHREGFAGQGAVEDDRFEQVGFVHGGQVKPGVSGLAAQAGNHIQPVDVVNLLGAARFQEAVQKWLKRSDGQVRARPDNFQQGKPLGQHQADSLGRPILVVYSASQLFQCAAWDQAHLAFIIVRQSSRKIRAQIEENTVDGFEIQSVIVDIFNFDQGVTGGVVHTHFWLNLLPNGFRGRQGMVAIAHRKQQDGLFRADIVMGLECVRVRQGFQGMPNLILQNGLGHLIAGQMTGAAHQLEIVCFFQLVFA
jgi:hypothetical protein